MDAITYDKDALRRLCGFSATAGRGTPLRIGIVIPVVVEPRLAVVEVEVRHVLGVVPRAAYYSSSSILCQKQIELYCQSAYMLTLESFIRRQFSKNIRTKDE